MEVIRHPRPGDPRLARSVLTLGNFDGVHLGHQAILQRGIAVARAANARVGLLTFHPHPVSVLAPEKAPPLIVPVRGKLELLRRAGLDFVWIVRFTPTFARLSPAAFVHEYLLSRAELVCMVVGYNVSFGRDRGGNASTLVEMGARAGFGVEVVGPITREGLRVSSTAVRRALRRGDVARAGRLLGRAHVLWGRVGGGVRRGRELGFPTANLERVGGLVPLDGVYAVRVEALGKRHQGIANIGCKPTFGAAARGVEVHLFDFQGDLYRQRLQVEFVERLRAEERFDSADALIRQIRLDAERARAILTASGRVDAPGSRGGES